MSFLVCLFIFLFYGCKPNKARHFMVENVSMSRVLVNGIDSGVPLYMLSIQLRLCDEYWAFPLYNTPYNEGIKDSIDGIKVLSKKQGEITTFEGVSSYEGKPFAALWLNESNDNDIFQVYYSASMKDLQDELNDMKILKGQYYCKKDSSYYIRRLFSFTKSEQPPVRIVLNFKSKHLESRVKELPETLNVYEVIYSYVPK